MTSKPPKARTLEATLRDRALTYPESSEDFPWGERAIKVRAKAFLFMRATGDRVSFSVKLPSSAADALEMPNVEPTGYGLGKHGWVTVVADSGRDAPVDEYLRWLDESYRAVAPKTLVKKLAAAPDATP